ncbi:MAG TPA: acetolactate synthase small subunit [bacterium]|nr:acetolactate synthase small subunit [bacterium]
MERKHTISVLVENEFGVLARVAGLFSSKGYNIDSLSVSETIDPTLSRMTIVTHGSDQIVEQIIKQLNKLVNVITVEDLTRERHVTREMCLVKVKPEAKADILKAAEKLGARILENNGNAVVLEVSGDEDDLQGAFTALKPFGIMEVVRTGMIAIQKGEHVLIDSVSK